MTFSVFLDFSFVWPRWTASRPSVLDFSSKETLRWGDFKHDSWQLVLCFLFDWGCENCSQREEGASMTCFVNFSRQGRGAAWKQALSDTTSLIILQCVCFKVWRKLSSGLFWSWWLITILDVGLRLPCQRSFRELWDDRLSHYFPAAVKRQGIVSTELFQYQ